MGSSPEITDLLLGLTSWAGAFSALAGISLLGGVCPEPPAMGTLDKGEGEKFQADGEFLILLLLLLGVFNGH